jgi:hypothetical protein
MACFCFVGTKKLKICQATGLFERLVSVPHKQRSNISEKNGFAIYDKVCTTPESATLLADLLAITNIQTVVYAFHRSAQYLHLS